ncbi:MAG: S8 family serine peptidase [Pseudomonadota bacterium]
MSPTQSLHIRVFDTSRAPLAGAEVEVDGRQVRPLAAPGQYEAKGLPQGKVRVRVVASGLEAEVREVEIGPARTEAIFILGQIGQPFYRRSGARVPFDPPQGAVGVTLRQAKGADGAALRQIGAELGGMDRIAIKAPGLLVAHVAPARAATMVRALRQRPEVVAAGPVAYDRDGGLAFFTGSIVVQMEPGQEGSAGGLAERYGLTLARKLTLPGFVVMMQDDPELDRLLLAAEALSQEPGVRSAEPELAYSLEFDAVTPTDELADDQWHLTVSRLPEAWQRLRDANPPGTLPGSAADQSFGRAEVIVAVVDSGVESQTDGGGNVTPTHPDFQGTVSDGQPKVVTFFDFANMAANNNAPNGDHGIQCAGVAVATALNASPVAGEEEGVVGAAPNCRLLAIQAPIGGPETVFSDLYLWTSGRPHASTDPAWPAALARGADVISNSHGGLNPAVFPVSALMTATFEDITDNALGGIGTIMCFSAGNADVEFAAERPWANHPRTIGVAASNENDVKASYSNFGDGIDLCAPSSDAALGLREITTTAMPGGGNLVGHTGGPMDYTDGFGGTSSATPFTAGIAALLRSMDPTLTWAEVRNILQRTASKIDFANTDADGAWRDTDGDGVADYSNWYGFGRVDAEKAVCVARTSVDLLTPTLAFLDVPEDETTLRAISFRVQSSRTRTFRVTSGPVTTTGPADSFVLHAGGVAAHAGRFDCVATVARIWVRYTATAAGDTATGSVEVSCDETGEVWTIPISANVVERPRAALVLSMDRSGSMDELAGDGRLKIELLRDSAAVVPALAQDDTGLGAVSWDSDADVAGAMAVTDAGPDLFGAGRVALQTHVSGHDTNLAGMTAIGDGVLAAQGLLDAASSAYQIKAMVVLTDGRETESLYLSELPAGSINGQVFAIGLGTAEGIQPAALATLTGEREGYLLMTGAMTADDYFLLAKYYQQVLAGVSNLEIVVDPDGWLQPGVPVRIPFGVNETDWQVDAVLHTPQPDLVRYWLETPDGQKITPAELAGEPESRFVVDRQLAFYRLSLPVSAVGPQDPAQPWHAVMEVDKKGWERYVKVLKSKKGREEPGTASAEHGLSAEELRTLAHGLRYSFVAQARSVLRMAPGVVQAGLVPGSEVRLGAIVTEYGMPPPRGATVRVRVTPPAGAAFTLSLTEGADGEFSGLMGTPQPGVYRLQFLGDGRTTRGSVWTREGLRSAVVWRGGNAPPPKPTVRDQICDLIGCLEKSGGLDLDLIRKLGVDPDALRRCLCKGDPQKR